MSSQICFRVLCFLPLVFLKYASAITTFLYVPINSTTGPSVPIPAGYQLATCDQANLYLTFACIEMYTSGICQLNGGQISRPMFTCQVTCPGTLQSYGCAIYASAGAPISPPIPPFPPRYPASYSPIPSPAQYRMNVTLVSGIIVGVLGGMLLLVLARGYYIRSEWQQQPQRTDVEIGRNAWATQAGFVTDPVPPVTDHATLNSSVPEHIIATFPVRNFSIAKAPATKSAFDLALASSYRAASEGISALRSAVSASVLGKPAGSVSLLQGKKASISMKKGDSLDVKDGNAAPLLLEVGEGNVVQNIDVDVGPEGPEAIGQSGTNSNAGTGLVAAHELEIFRVSRGMPSGRKIASISSPVVPQCAICLGDFEHGQEVRRLPCFHDFHKECIDGWMSQHRTCPLCRYVLYDPASDYDASHQYPMS